MLKEKSAWRQKKSVLASLEQVCATTGGATPTFRPWARFLGEFKELSSVVANQRQRVKIVETGETIAMTAPDQVLSALLRFL